MSLKLGVIGFSKGNGHPYSWSSIFNGYAADKMRDCSFPVIPQYLAEQKWPEAKIQGASVTHIWTQDYELSKHIADASLIQNVVRRPDELIGRVDAILLARDDAENHLEQASPFLKSGMPIYIDKPIALSLLDLEKLYALEQFPGQIFTCSALRYSNEMKLSPSDATSLGRVREIHAVTPKSWDRYIPHVIEPVLRILGEDDEIVHFDRSIGNASGGGLTVHWQSGVITRFIAVGELASSPLSIRVMGEKGWKDLFFTDAFSAFKAALQDFVHGIINRTVNSPPGFNRKVVELIEIGRKDVV
ncbi:MAG: hypothetical protein EP324_08570 [Gammaproteobacteria bacterium]|nr:MAG: hypothetical protein EP324_08570 [Gammaproteobacteria bacterium]